MIKRSFTEARHTCDQGDNLDSYTWTEYDSREGGVQVIKDSANNVKITTEFLKVAGGDHGGSWAARIKGEPINESTLPEMFWFIRINIRLAEVSRVSAIFYFGVEGFGSLNLDTKRGLVRAAQ